MNITNKKIKKLSKKIDSGERIKVAILGLGSVGNYLLTYLLEMADKNMEIIVVGRNEERLKKDLNIARVAASIRGKLLSKVSSYIVDFDNIEAITKFFNDKKPDFVVNSSRAYSGIKYGSISWKNIRAYGIWSPLSISVIKNIMVAYKNAKSDAIVINTSYSDSVNAWLKSAGLNYPDFGSGNLNHIIPRIKFVLKDMLNLSDDDVIDVTIATSHFHGVAISSEGTTDGVNPLLNIKINDKDIKIDYQELYKNCAITMPSDQKRNMMNASSNWEIINKILIALRENRSLTIHSPGVFGNIGGFPVTID
ncbi:MAG: saccharopine dehydrogenase NADP-binding domain-containing protein, partial [Sulfurovaceae bacterium]|nr:saccharopine dehydrogenase NADP-binding domain-containing protein [Sulfurovaceae bacterium]